MPLTEEERRELEESILAKYGRTQEENANEMESAREEASHRRMMLGLTEAAERFARAESVSRGGQGVDSGYYQGLRSGIDKDLAAKRAASEAKLKGLKDQDAMQWQDEQRGRQRQQWEREDRSADTEAQRSASMNDPESEESQMYQTLASQMMKGRDFSGMTAAQLGKAIPSLNSLYQTEQSGRLAQAKMTHQSRLQEQQNELQNQLRQDKRDREAEELRVGDYGIARTRDDAKKLKDAIEKKSSFDRKLKEMIKLREDKEVEYWDRASVKRGQQLSKELLLDYKQLAKLGVLSKADESIINAVIPDDPLGQDWEVSQDSVMHRLTKFKEGMDQDFQATLQNRLRNPPAAVAQSDTGGGAERSAAASELSDVDNKLKQIEDELNGKTTIETPMLGGR